MRACHMFARVACIQNESELDKTESDMTVWAQRVAVLFAALAVTPKLAFFSLMQKVNWIARMPNQPQRQLKS